MFRIGDRHCQKLAVCSKKLNQQIHFCLEVALFEQLIKGTNSTSPCTRLRMFLLVFLETNPCPTLYPTLCFWKQLRGRGILHSQACPEEQEKRPGFCRSRMRLIAMEFHDDRILLIYFRTLVTAKLMLRITLSVNLLWQHTPCKETHSSTIALIQRSI